MATRMNQALSDALSCGNQRCPCRRGSPTHCPAHDDSKPSLTVDERDGRVLFHCQSGCSQDSVIQALASRGLWPLTENQPLQMRGSREPDMVYRYLDSDGNLVAEHGRWNNPKSFAWRLPNGSWRDGLQGLKEDQLPLYNLSALREATGAVWLVEGEKAAESCISRGLTTVCLGGGAAQRDFGNALDPLIDREVILWPDFDDAGAAYMARIAAMLPHARFVNPAVPPKGDAADYFAQGGTVEALQSLLREGAPAVRVLSHDSVEVDIPQPNGSVTFRFIEMSWAARSIDAALRIEPRLTGVPRDPWSGRISLASTSGRETIRREIEAVYGGAKKAIPWASMLSTACSKAEQAWKEIDTSLDLSAVQPEPVSWFLDQRIPEKSVSILFGMGGSGKSFLALDMAMHSVMDGQWLGMPMAMIDAVLVIDYEDRPEIWRSRAEGICRANGWEFPERAFWYLPGNAVPIHEHRHRIAALVEKHKVGLVIVDSASSASGGALLDSEAVSKVINPLQALGVTVLLTAHNTKSEDAASTMYPYGNIAWHNLVRATHYVEHKQEEGSREAYVTIWNRKANEGKQRPVGARILFPAQFGDPLTIEASESARVLTEPPSISGQRNQAESIREWLLAQREPMSVQMISRHTGIPEESVRKNLNDRRGSWFTAVGSGRPQLWAVVAREWASNE